mgnify:CR=1 FL=1
MTVEKVSLLAGLIAGVTFAMNTGQILMSFGIAISTIIIVSLAVFGYKKIVKKLLIKNLEVTQNKESPKYDDEGNGYYIVELEVKQRNWLYNLFFRGVRLEVFTRTRFQGTKGEFSCPTDEITLGLDRPRRLFTVEYGKIAKLNIVKSKDFILTSLRETDFCGQELQGDYSLTILVNTNKEKTELPCPLCIKESNIGVNYRDKP